MPDSSSSPLAWAIANYFPPAVGHDVPAEWNDWQVPETDDADLIRRMTQSRSATAAFGGHASAGQLWDADPHALARAYPDPSGGRPYDASSADAALAQHLAFWTRRDHARILRLMWKSRLARDKWERDDYLPRTIIKACALCRDVLAPPAPPVAAPTTSDVPALPGATTGQPAAAIPIAEPLGMDTYLSPDAQPEWFKGCVYIISMNRVLTPGGHTLNKEQFDVVYGGRTFAMDAANMKVAKSAWDAFTHSQAFKFPRAHVPCFRPEMAEGATVEDAGRILVNTYAPINTPSIPGDIEPFNRHMRRLFPVERDRLVIEAYLAALVQFPGDKFQWCPVIQGAEGNGKSLILNVAEHAVGHRYSHRPNAQDLSGNGGKFTAWIQGRLLIGVEEIKVSDRMELLETLKPMVSNDSIEIQAKGVDQYTGDNRANFLMFSNHKDAIPQRIDGRRYAVFFTPQQEKQDILRDGMGGDYFPKLYAWLRGGGYAHITHWLKTYAIPLELSPAVHHGGMLHRAPETTSTSEALRFSMGRIEQEVLSAVAGGEPGFCGGWISSVMLGRLIKEVGGRGLSPLKQGEMCRSLGYIPHPDLPNGRVNNIIMPDGKKPVLYVKAGHLALNEHRPAEIARMYTAAQPGAFGAPGVASVG